MDKSRKTTHYIFLSGLVSLIIAIIVTPAGAQFRQSGSVSFTNTLSEYKDFSEIAPILLNGEDRTIHILYTLSNARLMRFNEQVGEWEQGRQRRICILGSYPIEVLPGQDRTITVDWRAATGNSKIPDVFLLKDIEAQRPRRGTYKLFLPYAFDEWRFGKTPKQIYYAESSEFRITK